MILYIMLKVKMIYQILIIALLVVIFLVSCILNMKTKVPKGKDGEELNEKCQSCTSTSCMIKLVDADKLKEELKKELEKNCEEDKNNEQ